MFQPCIVIPVYNHSKILIKFIDKILKHKIPIIVIDDGSNLENQIILKRIKKAHSNIIFERFDNNQGKGSAVMQGLLVAQKKRFSHVLQIDADNQHLPEDIPLFIKKSKESPFSLILGVPIYDETVPKLRFYGKKITNFWVAIETLSLKIPDAMCGFRIYPLKKTTDLIKTSNVSKRMGFDIDIVVKLYRKGLEIIEIPTKVIYPKEGTSNFNYFRDNLEISVVHIKLVFGMFYYLPSFLYQKIILAFLCKKKTCNS